jgi:hypothetical protein
VLAGALACAAISVAVAAPAAAATPRTVSGHHADVVSTGVTTPTAFAFHDGTVFEADGGNDSNKRGGGVFVLRGGRPHRLAGSPQFVAGLAWSKGALYLSGGTPTSARTGIFEIERWSGWNGRSFASRRTIYTAPGGFQGFNGLAIGPDGRLYVGVDLGLLAYNDHGPSNLSPYLYDILSMTTSGRDFTVYATGIRQPWQMVFPAGWRYPLVSDLGQDNGSTSNPLDLVLRVRPGDDYGFPRCAAVCTGFAQPWAKFSPHTDVMGLALMGKTLYMASYLGPGANGPGEILSMPLRHGKARPAVVGFNGAVIALGTDGTSLYIGQPGQKSGQGIVYSVKP